MSSGNDNRLALVANWWEWHRHARGNRLLNQHGDAVIDEVEQHARSHQLFARALSFVQISDGAVSDATLARLASWR
jgi:hypothetical protein